MAQEVERTSKPINDPVITEYVNRVGQNLVRNSDAKVPFTIKVIDSDQINAFALPGGFFYVNSGLILAADSEAELASVMGHEISHVAARHGTRNATKGEIAQLAMIPVMMLGPGGLAGLGIYEGLNVAIPLGFLQFSRDNEFEADYLGLQYMYKAGYDPNAFVTFFEKVEAEEKRQPGKVPKVFSTHPPTPERVAAIQKEIGQVLPARDQYIVTTSEFDTVQARLRRVESRDKLQESKNSGDKPTLRTRTERQPQTSSGSGPKPDLHDGGPQRRRGSPHAAQARRLDKSVARNAPTPRKSIRVSWRRRSRARRPQLRSESRSDCSRLHNLQRRPDGEPIIPGSSRSLPHNMDR